MTRDTARPVLVHDVGALRDAIGAVPRSVGLVPTVDGVHQAQLALVERSRAENAVTVVSVAVSPAPWEDETDSADAPRDAGGQPVDRAERCRNIDADIVFAPAADALYAAGFATSLTVDGLTDGLEGAHHPRRLRGLATEIVLLLQLVRPTRAYLGELDWQLLQTVRRLVRDLRFDVTITGVPIVRDADGLARSDDNARLSPEAREGARSIAAALHQAGSLFSGGVRDVAVIESRLRTRLLDEPELDVEYAVVVDAESLQYVTQLYRPARALVAATIGGVRLIDNIALG